MTNYLKLTEFELRRFKNLYFGIIGLIVVLQLAYLMYSLTSIKGFIRERLSEDFQMAEIVQEHGKYSLSEIFYSTPILLTIAIGVVTIALYILFIWYRDWIGETMFIYRLMMVPTRRMNIFFSKLTTIILYTLGIVIVQLGVLFLYDLIIQAVLPKEFTVEQSIFQTIQSTPLEIVIPYSFQNFVISYGVGIMFVCIAFTAVLIERAFRLKGIIFAILYVAVFTALFIFAMIWPLYSDSIKLYPNEYKFIFYPVILVITLVQLILSNYLLERRMNL